LIEDKAVEESNSLLATDVSPEMRAILISEKNHFTPERIIFLAISFVSLYLTQKYFGSPA
jgi:hypothetical protein